MNTDELGFKLSKNDVLSYIVDTIRQRKWKVNEKIYSENQLSKILGVSRSMVREAYIALEGVGIIETIHGDGTYLRQFEEIDNDSPLSLLMMLVHEDFEKLMQFRKVIEIGMVEPCINNIDDYYISLLKNQLSKMKNIDEYKHVSSCDIRIHTIICESIGNPFLSLVYNMTIGYLNYMSEKNWESIKNAGDVEIGQELYNQHEAIVNGIIKRDVVEATQAVIYHLNYINSNLNQFNE
ncbi:MAG: FCD domain-containing protein [Tissierellaceae bacterium]|nr:FCD domain-containing protein [Tissierellaceae bacterium]